MKPEDYDIVDLIGKELTGEATGEEKAFVDRWRMAHAENEKEYQRFLLVFQKSELSSSNEFDTEAAWKKVQARIPQAESGNTRTLYFTWARLAAAIALVAITALMVLVLRQQPVQQYAVSTGPSILRDTLPDGSKAFLNKESSITYAVNLSLRQRTVKLKGEAFFEVQHHEKQSFVIEAQEVMIQDIGTSFNVQAYPDKDTITISVRTGQVRAFTPTSDGVILDAGQSAVYSRTSKTFHKLEKADTNVLAYQNKVFTFNNTDLKTIVEKINEVYGSHIILHSPALNNCRVTVNFNNEDPDAIADILAETLRLTIIREDDRIILNGEGCK
ncbi:MAG: FecR domain-containing protein [Bacteroidetes bacterium]|nr:FecR domain-containing protein [Bacteroidota bacterium]